MRPTVILLLRGAILGVTSVVSASCSIHPLPDDTTGLSTYQITKQITCETRTAIVDSIIGFLTNPANRRSFDTSDPAKSYIRVDAHSQSVGLYYQQNRDRINSFNYKKELTGNAQYIVGVILSTGIAYNYDLEMTEINNNDGIIDVLSTFTHSTIAFGVAPKLDLQRMNTRLFTTSTTFTKLVSGPASVICKPSYSAGENILYPIAGRIGMEKVIQDFAQQAVFGNLSGDETKDFSKAAGPVQLAEQLQFTTTLDLSITPKITFAPVPLVGSGVHVADASFSGDAQRKDVHKLTLGLFIPTDGPLDESRNAVLSSLEGIPPAKIVSAPTHNSDAEKGAQAVLNQLLYLKIFQINTTINIQ